MICLQKPELTFEQIEKCKQCKHASEKKIWCCKFGFYFNIESRLIPPKITIPKQTPTVLQMASDFTRAMIKWGKSGLKCVSKEDYLARRTICSKCTDGWRCPHCGCMLWAKIALATEKCPENKW